MKSDRKSQRIIASFLYFICILVIYYSVTILLVPDVRIAHMSLWIGILASLFFIEILSGENTCSEVEIYSNKDVNLVFFILWLISIIVALFVTQFKRDILLSERKMLLLQFTLVLSIFICYFFHIKLTHFIWKINTKGLIITVCVFMIYFIPQAVMKERVIIKSLDHRSLFEYMLFLMRISIYPSFYEEFLYRGLLISWLKQYKLKTWQINIIQSIVFGISHFTLYIDLGWKGFLATGPQALLGYLLGSLYFKTKSLTPGILLHTLLNGMILQ